MLIGAVIPNTAGIPNFWAKDCASPPICADSELALSQVERKAKWGARGKSLSSLINTDVLIGSVSFSSLVR